MPIFAKIQGKTLYADNDDDEELPDINLDITQTKVFLGRADTYPADESLGTFLGASHSKSVSRRHLTISWDPDRDQWQLYVDSKNGVVVDAQFWEQGKTVDLFHRSAIKFGPCACYFVLPGGEGEPVIAASTVAAPARAAAAAVGHAAAAARADVRRRAVGRRDEARRPDLRGARGPGLRVAGT